ncbi:HAD family hydrolase [Microbacterium sp.]|uniref:HAD family hydrolase n=1 Tax=Microbacterium sp. TaxID=51671 RepID=UPI003A87BF48
MEPAAVIFDLDGVLIDSESLWDRVREALAREHGGTWYDGVHRAMMGMNSAEWSGYMHDELGVRLSPAEILDHVSEALIERYRVDVPSLPGAAAAVRRMGRRWPLAVASSSPLRVIEAALAAMDIRGEFAAVVSSESVPRGKPAPDVFLEAAARLQVEPACCAAIEDSAGGIRAAAAAGMRVVAIPNPDYRPDPDAIGHAAVLLDAIAGLTPELLTPRDERGAP